MSEKLKLLIGIIVVFVAAFLIRPDFGSHVAGAGTGEPSSFDNVSLTGGLKLGVAYGDLSIPSLGNGSLFASGPAYFAQDITEGGLCSVSLASTTNTYAITSANISNCNYLSITSGSTTGSVTLQLPASSTVATALSNIGDSTTLYVYMASTTANNAILTATTTAGFAIASPIGVASTTAASSTITAGNTAILDITRQPTTNLSAIITPTK